MKLAGKLISQTLSALLFVLLLVMILLVLSSKASGGQPEFFGYQLKTVLSGSMEPGIQTGSIIAVKTGGDMNRFQPGDVITFKMDEKDLATHRIVAKKASGQAVIYTTKGDNNKTPDSEPVLAQNVTAQYTGFTIPYIGYFIEYAKSKEGNALLFIIPGLLLIGYSIITIWRVISRLEEPKRV
ncbi:signal peptidase I [Bacillus sp. FJAT-42376]|uniref:signal peptidase I SipW n=1 Tax=Bacillus sp. FJAT-42376 TaxID=2014076 RepID=UPI000F4F42E5|nr:signal peptidase I [Bacillus sp. FJAT-42376]AZB43567.1 signal peptidase I [Bacillus sp. FJAT-42376]